MSLTRTISRTGARALLIPQTNDSPPKSRHTSRIRHTSEHSQRFSSISAVTTAVTPRHSCDADHERSNSAHRSSSSRVDANFQLDTLRFEAPPMLRLACCLLALLVIPQISLAQEESYPDHPDSIKKPGVPEGKIEGP